MTADLQQATIATYGHDEKPITSTTAPTSPPRKDASNPQQGMADPATGSIGATTAATVSNTPCTSPLTVTSLEAAAAAGTAAANNANCVVPAVVSQVMAVPASVDGLLSTMAKLGLVSPLPPAASNNNAVGIPPPPPPMMEKMRLRTPPTEHDNRKLFVGGLPTDVTDRGFLEFFEQFGEVMDSVVMVDRVTKRSRGFGFVTFSDEEDANSLLTSIPGKTGYVLINGKQCEVKASTPKVDDGPSKHNQHASGMWRSNPPHRDNNHRGYSPHSRSSNGPMKQQVTQHHHHQHRGEKHFYIDQELDGRNFDEVYTGPPHVDAIYSQPMNAYGRTSNYTASNPSMYQQNYQNAYYNQGAAGAPDGYTTYPNSSAGASGVPSSYEASYPAAPQGGNTGYYDAYAAQYSSQYANQYSNNSMQQPPPMMMGQGGYASYNTGYYSDGGSAAPMPAPGVHASDTGGFEPYPQSYPADAGDYGQAADQYE